jgi:hypothetical protein
VKRLRRVQSGRFGAAVRSSANMAEARCNMPFALAKAIPWPQIVLNVLPLSFPHIAISFEGFVFALEPNE